MEIQYDDKQPFFNGLPFGWRIATIHDFYSGDDIILKLPYLIHSEVNPGKYWACRTKVGFMERNDFILFLQKGRVYVTN